MTCQGCDDYGVLDGLEPCPNECPKSRQVLADLRAPQPKWVDLLGIDPNYLEGADVNEWLEEQRGEA